MHTENESVTELLAQLSKGNREAESRLIAQVYGELRRLAANCMRRERRDHSLQPTALVNEAFLRLAQRCGRLAGAAHFFAVAAQIMRRILVDHARARVAGKRVGGAARVSFTEDMAHGTDRTWEVLAIHEAMERLEKVDPRQGRLVELRFFAGMSFDEIALVMNVSGRTVRRDWAVARAWLHRSWMGDGDVFHAFEGALSVRVRWFASYAGRVHFIDEGSGPAILFCHGNPTWSFLYRNIIIALRGRFRCVALDYPGYGLSDRPAGYGYTPGEQALVVAELIAHLDLRNFILFGQDWGGPIGLGAVLADPGRVRGLAIRAHVVLGGSVDADLDLQRGTISRIFSAQDYSGELFR